MRMSGFTGPSYVASSSLAADQRCMNLYPDQLQVGGEKAQAYLRGVPGLEVWQDLGVGPVRGLFAQDGRAFAIAGTNYHELFADASNLVRGTVVAGNDVATSCSNGRGGLQLLNAAGGKGYTFRLDTNTFAQITDADFPANVRAVGFLDGYGLALTTGGQLYLSALNDFSSWAAADVAARSRASDLWEMIAVQPPLVWLFGNLTTEIWYNNGNATFPFGPVQGIFVDEGIAVPHSVASIGGSLIWLSANRAGERQVVGAPNYTPTVLSTPAVDRAIQSYGTITDAVGFTYQEDGHLFYVLTFPTAKATWAYDTTTQQWHERGTWNAGDGAYEAHPGRCHCVAFGNQLLGSRTDGKIYRQSLGLYDYAGATMRKLRRPPHVADGLVRLLHKSLTLDAEVGVGLTDGQGEDPQMMLRWSDNGGKTYGNEHWATLGKLGEYRTRVTWNRLGSARDRVYEFVCSDPIKLALIDAHLDVEKGVS